MGKGYLVCPKAMQNREISIKEKSLFLSSSTLINPMA